MTYGNAISAAAPAGGAGGIEPDVAAAASGCEPQRISHV
jgi:hypothetical protein